MKRLLILLASVLVLGTVYSQTLPTALVVSKRTEFPNLKGDQVITRMYNEEYSITHFRHKENAYVHSFLIQYRIPVITKEIQFNINGSMMSDTLYRLTVNDMRIEGDSCYFCGNVVHVGPPMINPQGHTFWPERDSVGFVGYFSITELLEGHVFLKYQLFYDVYDLTRMATVTYPHRASSLQLMVAAIGTLSDKTTPCVLELKKYGDGSWKRSLSYPNSVDEVFSDILYNPYRLLIASYRRCNGDEGEYQNEPNHWKFTLHYASNYGFCTDYASVYNSETAAEYDTYGLTVDHSIGWHPSEVQLRLCRLGAGRMCMAYGTNLTTVILFSMPNEPLSADTITYFWSGAYSPAVVQDMVGLPIDNSVAVVASGGFEPNENEERLFFPTISTSLLWIPYVKMYGVLKRSVDRWNAHTAITSGYQSVNDNNTIVNLLQDKNTLYPTISPPITCFGAGIVSYTAIESLYADKGKYEWNSIYKDKSLDWRTHICIATTVTYESTCTKEFPTHK